MVSDAAQKASYLISNEIDVFTLVNCLALWFCDPQLTGSNQVGYGQCYELFGEIAPIN